MAVTFGKTAESMKVNTKTIRSMERVLMYGLMGANMTACGRMEGSMDVVSTYQNMV